MSPEQLMIVSLNEFLRMLDQKYDLTPSHSYRLKISEIPQKCLELLDQGVEAKSRPYESVTPLMLYATFNITDARFIEQLIKPGEIKKIFSDGTHTFSALTLAACNGAVDTLNMLIETGQFTQDHMEEAVYFATLFSQQHSIEILKKNGINLFKPYGGFRITALHVACKKNASHIVNILLQANPTDFEVGYIIQDGENRETGYTIAVNNGYVECEKLLENYPSSIYKKMVNVIDSGNILNLRKLLEQHSNLIYCYDGSLYSIFSMIAEEGFKNPAGYKSIIDEQILKLNDHTTSEQIEALILTLFLLLSFDVSFPIVRDYVDLMWQKLKELKPYYKQVASLLLDGVRERPESLDVLVNDIIIKSKNNLKRIIFYSYSPGLCEVNRQSLVNIDPSEIIKLVAALLEYTQFIECNIFSDKKNECVVDLLNLVLDRNKLMVQSLSDIVKDKIYNSYVSTINDQIQVIKDLKIDGHELLIPLQKINKTYSLRELVSFFIVNPKQSGTESNDNNNNSTVSLSGATQDALDLLETMKISTLPGNRI